MTAGFENSAGQVSFERESSPSEPTPEEQLESLYAQLQNEFPTTDKPVVFENFSQPGYQETYDTDFLIWQTKKFLGRREATPADFMIQTTGDLICLAYHEIDQGFGQEFPDTLNDLQKGWLVMNEKIKAEPSFDPRVAKYFGEFARAASTFRSSDDLSKSKTFFTLAYRGLEISRKIDWQWEDKK